MFFEKVSAKVLTMGEWRVIILKQIKKYWRKCNVHFYGKS